MGRRGAGVEKRRLQWAAIALPALLLGGFEFVRHRWLEHSLPGTWGNLLSALIVAGAGYGFIRYFSESAAETEKELGRSRAEAAVLAERQRIAREMHDGVAQVLFHVRVRLGELESTAGAGLGPELGLLRLHVGTAYEQVRAAVADLKQAQSAEDPLEALRRAAVQAAGQMGVDLHLDLRGLPDLSPTAAGHVAAIAAEAISNAARHGRARQVTLRSDQDQLAIHDDGEGFEPGETAGDGFGLMIMEERAGLAGARLRVESARGRGTLVKLRWDGETDENADSDRR